MKFHLASLFLLGLGCLLSWLENIFKVSMVNASRKHTLTLTCILFMSMAMFFCRPPKSVILSVMIEALVRVLHQIMTRFLSGVTHKNKHKHMNFLLGVLLLKCEFLYRRSCVKASLRKVIN